jgi:phosphoglycolate phosphatase-like HAD superfamily hydrolase
MRIVFDLDGTLCTGYPYEDAVPLPGAQETLRKLKEQGHTIIIYTARGMGSCAGNSGAAVAKIGGVTLTQLKDWDFIYDEIVFGKPAGDIYVDDKSIPSLERLPSLLGAESHDSTRVA